LLLVDVKTNLNFMSRKILKALLPIVASATAAFHIGLILQQPAYSQSAKGCSASGGKPKGCPPKTVPEPITVVGTLIGGAAAWSIRKKLISSGKQ
jgi:hypothetical protein